MLWARIWPKSWAQRSARSFVISSFIVLPRHLDGNAGLVLDWAPLQMYFGIHHLELPPECKSNFLWDVSSLYFWQCCNPSTPFHCKYGIAVHLCNTVQWSVHIYVQCIKSPHNKHCNVVYSTVCRHSDSMSIEFLCRPGFQLYRTCHRQCKKNVSKIGKSF